MIYSNHKNLIFLSSEYIFQGNVILFKNYFFIEDIYTADEDKYSFKKN